MQLVCISMIIRNDDQVFFFFGGGGRELIFLTPDTHQYVRASGGKKC